MTASMPKTSSLDLRGQPIYRRVSLKRPLSTYGKVQRLYSALIRGRAFQVQRWDLRSKRYLNAGCGPNQRPAFINLDYDWLPGIDVCWDLRTKLPFADNSLLGVYSEHCLEHLSPEDCRHALKEFKRVLAPGGLVRIVVPDAEIYFDLYQMHKAGREVDFPYVPAPLPVGFTPLMAVNQIFFQHGHLYAYDAETMGVQLKNAGFSNIKKESFMHGSESNLLIDSSERAVESLYMEARA